MKALYSWALTEPMPYTDSSWMSDEEIRDCFFDEKAVCVEKRAASIQDIRYMLEVNWNIPLELHN